MMNTQPGVHHHSSYQAAAPEKGARHWIGYGTIASLHVLTALTWFSVAVATVSFRNEGLTYGPSAESNASNANGVQQVKYPGYLLTVFYAFFNMYAWRLIASFASLVITYNADRYFMSRGAAWASWTTNLLILFSWLATDLPFVYSALSSFQGADTTGANDSSNTAFCADGVGSRWCEMNYAHSILSIIQDGVVLVTFLYSCYQMARARSNILLTWSEVGTINLTALGICGYLCWTLASIPLAYTRSTNVFAFLDPRYQLNTWQMYAPSIMWGNYLLHGAFIFALSQAASVSFGATKSARMTALLLNWLSFMTLFPAFLYMARTQNEGSAGQCSTDHFNGNLRCPTLDGVTAGMGICSATTFLLGVVLMAVYAQPERADFAIAKAAPPLATQQNIALDNTRPPTPTHAGGVVNQPIQQGQYGARSVELGQPVYRQEEMTNAVEMA